MTNWTAGVPYTTRMDIQLHHKEVDNGWRQWIAENLLLGHPSESIIKRMVQEGFDYTLAQNEVAQAANHPYIQAGLSFSAKIKKRDWILNNYCLLEQESLSHKQIERKYKLSRQEFLCDYYTRNRPVIIQGAMDHWPAMSKWRPEWLKQNFGHRLVEIQANRHSNRLYEIDMLQHQKQILFGDYIDQVTSHKATNDFYMTASNMSKNQDALKELWDDMDGLPEYLDTENGRQGFFWFGPAGTITPLHHDLTNNFMAQVYGRKLIKLVSACHTPYLYNHLHCYSELDMENIDYERYPLFQKANVVELILEPGEILFLPVGCWHYVRGLDISITMSLTHFVFNNDFSSNYSSYHKIY